MIEWGNWIPEKTKGKTKRFSKTKNNLLMKKNVSAGIRAQVTTATTLDPNH